MANSLAGVLAGARQVECTINGIGERAGNAALEEIVMALKVRKDIMPFTTGINTTLLNRASKLVSNVTGFPVQYNKAIVGKNAFSHESGIHQDGMLKNVETYEIMRPEDVGVNATSLMLGKLSGRHAFKDKLENMGYVLETEAFEDAFKRFKDLADKKKHVFDEDIAALVDDEIMRGQDSHLDQGAAGGIGHRHHPGRLPDPVGRRQGQERHDQRRRPGGRHLHGDPRGLSPYRHPAAVPDQRRDRGHRRPGPGQRPAGGKWPHRHRQGLGHRHHGGCGLCLCECVKQAAGETRKAGARRALTGRIVM